MGRKRIGIQKLEKQICSKNSFFLGKIFSQLGLSYRTLFCLSCPYELGIAHGIAVN
jgi:hypothetical protein